MKGGLLPFIIFKYEVCRLKCKVVKLWTSCGISIENLIS